MLQEEGNVYQVVGKRDRYSVSDKLLRTEIDERSQTGNASDNHLLRKNKGGETERIKSKPHDNHHIVFGLRA